MAETAGILRRISGLVVVEIDIGSRQTPFPDPIGPELQDCLVVAALVFGARAMQPDVGEVGGEFNR